ncbi:RNA polymerase sigma factor [Maridesulfovibrio salexigens]|uniref:RNA polymerase, sigma-24 subunit, ECF subfamily n=1 Tax=Maridesulfovibrio salexigens (strain ATCC 14822 / DSM 2638 / NCIMB 8403 / VKM B-1763) TaxID=526222 RepID=C6BXL8_MARSD|nr:sigma-70 family RNA polymerase sigma factor [Maridesulfovibrio salexigens]ACS78576.1 RNA polymerase, sigma-24 subunit, ECF subfamily [Maridesulfovibrio salexigens DSM 2638]
MIVLSLEQKAIVNIIKKCTEGDRPSWNTFVEKYSGIIYFTINNTLKSKLKFYSQHHADDICQNVFLRLVQNDRSLLKRYDPQKAKITTWLMVISRSVTMDFLRKGVYCLAPLDDFINELEAPADPVQEGLDIPEQLLSPRQKLIVKLYFEDGLDISEISDFIGIKEQSVRSAKHKALTKLRSYHGVSEESYVLTR